MRRHIAIVVGLGLLLAVLPSARATGSGPGGAAAAAPLAAPLGPGITYQGFLKQGGVPANGTFAMQFQLFDAATGGVQVGPTLSPSVPVTNGQFTVALDFGVGAFNGEARWLAITVQGTSLSPRQAVTAAPYAVALGGLRTEPNGTSANVIGGFSGNSVTSGVVGATIGGGGNSGFAPNGPNQVTDDYGTVGGGANNRAGNNAGTTSDAGFATVGGGAQNTASGDAATVAGGAQNTASGNNATVAGGQSNTASGDGDTVAGGVANTAGGNNATVGGGLFNTASGTEATVVGGFTNVASGLGSFAAGSRAQALGDGTFVWNDRNSADVTFASNSNLSSFGSVSTTNSFHVRATGGARFVTNTSHNAGLYVNPGGTAWNAGSHSSLKTDFAAVDPRAVLEGLARLPLTTWRLRDGEPGVRHLGPMAEDFYAAFGLGDGDRAINTLDADGVAFAAIQGLYSVVQEQAAEVTALQAANAALQAANGTLAETVAELEAANATLAETVAALTARLAAVEQAVAAGEAP